MGSALNVIVGMVPPPREAHRPRLHVSAPVLEVGRDHHVAWEHVGARRSEQPLPRVVGGEDIGVRIDVALGRHRDVALGRRIGRQHLPAVREPLLPVTSTVLKVSVALGSPTSVFSWNSDRPVLSRIFPPREDRARIIGRPDPVVGPGSGLVFAIV